MQKFADENDKALLEEMRNKEAEDLAQILSKKYGLQYLDLSRMTIDLDALRIVPEETAKNAKVAVFQKIGNKLQVAIETPNSESAMSAIKDLEQKGFKATVYMVSEESLRRAWNRYSEVSEYMETSRGIIGVSPEKLEEFIGQTNTIQKLKGVFSSAAILKKDRKTSEVLEIILAGAISADASDIHIEPQKESVRLRLRIDGVLHDILFFDYKTYNLLLSRIKLTSGLKLNIHNQAQDGRFSIRANNAETEVRVSVIPEAFGESVVLRILSPKSISVSFEELGMEKGLFETMEKELKKPNGMILTTGPTGSGKTTTLYAFLKKTYTPEAKIITLEDPIEYHLDGIVQTQVEESTGYTFSVGLRSILRQDPDIIMVGEIRDLETARTAMNAALTGHMVLSTLHTNNAAGTIPRLIDLGANSNIIAPAINVAMAQRLVRKLCNICKEKYEPNSKEKILICGVTDSFPENLRMDIKDFSLWKAVGCNACNNIGYKGRVGVFEAILVDDKMETLILGMPSEAEILNNAKSQGILNMKQDGILKVLNGVTSLEELQRVIEL